MANVTSHETDAERRARQSREHVAKYVELAARIGAGRILARLRTRVSRDAVRAALAAGDAHLNTIPLGVWDSLADDGPGHGNGTPDHPPGGIRAALVGLLRLVTLAGTSGGNPYRLPEVRAARAALGYAPLGGPADPEADAVEARELHAPAPEPPLWPRGLSLAERVCTLKHVATQWAAGSL